MTDPIKWFISILAGCAQWRSIKSGRKAKREKGCERKDLEEGVGGGGGWEEKRRRKKAKSNRWFWWIRATADCRSSVSNFLVVRECGSSQLVRERQVQLPTPGLFFIGHRHDDLLQP